MMLLRFFCAIAVCAAVCVLAAEPVPTPTPPSQLTLVYTHKLVDEPWGEDVAEPTTLHYDADHGRQRYEYYDGQVLTIQLYATMTEYHITPANDKLICYFMPISPMASRVHRLHSPRASLVQSRAPKPPSMAARVADGPPSPYPNSSDYTWVGQYLYEGVVCNRWQMEMGPILQELFTDATTGMPIAELNFNGSTVIEYGTATAEPQPDSLFDVSSYDCKPFTPSAAVASGPHAEFLAYAHSHGRMYDGVAPQSAFRRTVFRKNMAAIRRHNADPSASFVMAPNQYADLLMVELRAMRMGLRAADSNARVPMRVQDPHRLSRPQEVDWRSYNAVSPVKDQGNCGSCWAFSSTGAIESAYYLKYKTMKLFSEQEFVDCTWDYAHNSGCDGGNQWGAYQWLVDTGKELALEKDYKYKECNGYCQAKGGLAAGGCHLQSYHNVTPGAVDELLDAVASVGPVAVSINTPMSFVFYDGGVYDDPSCKSTPESLDHAVLAVGYGTDKESGKDFWIIKNSWGPLWGDNGYIRMARHENMCGVATAALYPEVA